MADGAGDRFERVIPLDGPAVRALPLWGERRCFKGFCVELVPAGPRTVNFKLDQTFASISFAADEGRSSLAGDRLRNYDRRPHEFIVAPPNFPLFGEAAMAPEVLAFEVEFDVVCDAVAKELGVDPTTLRPEVVIGGPDPLATLLAGRIRRRILSAQSGDAHLEALCLCLLVEMLKPCRERRQRRGSRRVEEPVLQRLLDYIDANLEADLCVERLAGFAGSTAHQIQKTFKSVTGSTVHAYVLERRIERARQLLADPRNGLADIAAEAGFSSQSHMTSMFKSKLGITPGALRTAA